MGLLSDLPYRLNLVSGRRGDRTAGWNCRPEAAMAVKADAEDDEGDEEKNTN
jgi:hypothetical protein